MALRHTVAIAKNGIAVAKVCVVYTKLAAYRPHASALDTVTSFKHAIACIARPFRRVATQATVTCVSHRETKPLFF